MKSQKSKAWQAFFLLVLIVYPFRHIAVGLDLWDTGYNYSNFQYMGLEHMDSMWLFSTYLANAAGHFLTKLPFAGSLIGMNFYTGLTAMLLALMGYFFCTKTLKMPAGIVFAGELAALSLCWCPTALLYNYLTYILFLGCVILLYKGLTKEETWYLAWAGVCLGTNLFVRFSNLPQAAMIVAVWAYAIIVGQEKKEKPGKILARAGKHTLWCMGGYLAALLAFGGYISLRYGLDAYVAGIQRLFAMTDNAQDYKAASMVMGMVEMYRENLYWILRIGVIAAVGVGLFALVKLLMSAKFMSPRAGSLLYRSAVVLWGAVCIAMVVWFYARGFCAREYYHYGAILWPGVSFLTLTLFITIVRIFHKNSPKEEKLISGLVLLVVILTSLGSNNKLYPSMNNLFVAAPYVLWECTRFCKGATEYRWKRLVLCAAPLKGVLIACLALFWVQSLLFGAGFTFAEGTGVQEPNARVENNEVLAGVKMNPERAKWLTELSAYVKEHDLQGKEVIPYGNIPALSYYLQMPPAFNSWSDLRSYSPETMSGALFAEALMNDLLFEQGTVLERKDARPVIIIERQYTEFENGGEKALREMGLEEHRILEITGDKKWPMLVEFREKLGYEKTFENEKFTIWE